jgi:hypothetical protein
LQQGTKWNGIIKESLLYLSHLVLRLFHQRLNLAMELSRSQKNRGEGPAIRELFPSDYIPVKQGLIALWKILKNEVAWEFQISLLPN